ncbi:MAG: D-alanyl-D-alanine carboxypeptidase/D-alanyl-D-alanine-endopeptidase [Planctomycetes bacterium]|nr:D-alanyl-D-alanine carboxypeptidase/D-alanyl-D-alanine-endopeptidase [Planctomycetota bacterium]
MRGHGAGFVLIAAISAALSTLPVLAQPPLERELRAVLKAVPHVEVVTGVCIVELSSGRTVFEHQADQPLIPASSMKVFVMAAALAELGGEFAFETVLATDGADLHLIDDGDPSLGDARLCQQRSEAPTAGFERWAEELLSHHVTRVRGDLVIDESIFDEQVTNPTWGPDDLGKWYATPVGALNFNDNCLDITVSPARSVGELALVSMQPENSLAKIVNKCRTGTGKEPVLHHPPGTVDFVISGRCSKSWSFSPVSFPDPGLLTADVLRTVLARKGITLAGKIRRERVRQPDGKLPPLLSVIGRQRTPITDVMQRAGKNSQNLFAECLLKRLGHVWAKRHGTIDPRGSWTLGGQALVEATRSAGIDTTGLLVADGSGLSRANRCTARQLAAILVWMDRHPEARLFRNSLSVAGVDGSLQKQLKDLSGRVHAKTGTMRGVRTLAGYVDAPDGTRYAFAVMFNGYKGPSTPYRELQDRICRILANSPAG